MNDSNFYLHRLFCESLSPFLELNISKWPVNCLSRKPLSRSLPLSSGQLLVTSDSIRAAMPKLRSAGQNKSEWASFERQRNDVLLGHWKLCSVSLCIRGLVRIWVGLRKFARLIPDETCEEQCWRLFFSCWARKKFNGQMKSVFLSPHCIQLAWARFLLFCLHMSGVIVTSS